jgi:heme-degrading monooxygenase HmoA
MYIQENEGYAVTTRWEEEAKNTHIWLCPYINLYSYHTYIYIIHISVNIFKYMYIQENEGYAVTTRWEEEAEKK